MGFVIGAGAFLLLPSFILAQVPDDDLPTPPGYIPSPPPPRGLDWVLLAGLSVELDEESEGGPYIVARITPEAGSRGHFLYSKNLVHWTPASLPQTRDGSEITTRLRAEYPPLFIRYVQTADPVIDPN
jgi:hypothetical protein